MSKWTERGSLSVETIFYVIIFAVTFFGAVELGRGVVARHALDSGVWEATRYLSIHPSDWTTADTIIRNSVANSPVGGSLASQVVITVDMPDSSFGSQFRVRAEAPFQAIVPLIGAMTPRTIYAEHTLRIEAYP